MNEKGGLYAGAVTGQSSGSARLRTDCLDYFRGARGSRQLDLAMLGFTAAVKRTAKSLQQQLIADWLKKYTTPVN